MIEGIDLNQIRQYNTSLKQYRDKAANINAQIEFTKKELNSLCAELTAELGVEVNESNIDQIYQEQVEKINNTLKSGNTILSKIAEEEQKLSMGQVTQGSTAQTPPQTPPVAPQTPPVAPQVNVQQPGVVNQTQQFESNSVAGSVFGNGSPIGADNMFKLGVG